LLLLSCDVLLKLLRNEVTPQKRSAAEQLTRDSEQSTSDPEGPGVQQGRLAEFDPSGWTSPLSQAAVHSRTLHMTVMSYVSQPFDPQRRSPLRLAAALHVAVETIGRFFVRRGILHRDGSHINLSIA
jgi:hypothetical protein